MAEIIPGDNAKDTMEKNKDTVIEEIGKTTGMTVKEVCDLIGIPNPIRNVTNAVRTVLDTWADDGLIQKEADDSGRSGLRTGKIVKYRAVQDS